jgi:hypothetical protein
MGYTIKYIPQYGFEVDINGFIITFLQTPEGLFVCNMKKVMRV